MAWEDFSTSLLCLYFALARERGLDQPKVWLAPTREESRGWGDLFPLDRDTTQVRMCRNLAKVLLSMRLQVTEEHRHFVALAPDVWIQDKNHAIIVENKTGGHGSRHETEYLEFLHQGYFDGLKRAFLYTVPQAWLPDRKAYNEWWQFVRERKSDDPVLRGMIAWDDEFAEFLCDVLRLPKWWRDKLPNKVNEGKYLASGQPFWGEW